LNFVLWKEYWYQKGGDLWCVTGGPFTSHLKTLGTGVMLTHGFYLCYDPGEVASHQEQFDAGAGNCDDGHQAAAEQQGHVDELSWYAGPWLVGY